MIYPVRAAAYGHDRNYTPSYGIIDKRGFPLDDVGLHPERIAEAIADAINAAYKEIPA